MHLISYESYVNTQVTKVVGQKLLHPFSNYKKNFLKLNITGSTKEQS